MISFIIKLFILLHITNSFEVLKQSVIEHAIYDNILCRECGTNITSSNYIFSKSSPVSQYSFNETLFSKDEVLVQVLSSDFYHVYPVITTTSATCWLLVGFEQWKESDSWFLGYRWKHCLCPKCQQYLGWVFETIDPNSVHSPSTFFGLDIRSLIGENYLNSLTLYPGGWSN